MADFILLCEEPPSTARAEKRSWTVASLAATAGISRTRLARRFTEIVGEPPLTFLTHWRLALAADLMLEPGSSLTSVARKVGYSSPFALSAAFIRVRGLSPSEHRESAREKSADAPVAV